MRFRAVSLSLLLAATLSGAEIPTSPIAKEDLDPAAFAEWSNGKETPIDSTGGQEKILWTGSTASDWGGLSFGENKVPGIRHLRLAWK
ncbi:MAG: hypothetical protein EOP83_11550, partial [Verrucomicrobiaceae bacterium]